MDPNTAMISQVVGKIAERVEHAGEAIRPVPQGIEWGKPGWRQRLWCGDPIEGDEGAPTLVRIRLLTEVCPALPAPAEWPEESLQRFLDSAVSNLWGGLVVAPEMDGSLCFAAAVSAHEGNIGYLPDILFSTAGGHGAARWEILVEEEMGFIKDLPGLGTPGDLHRIYERCNDAMGMNDPDPEGMDQDLAYLVQQFQEFPCLMCNGDEGGLTAEFPFGEESSLMRVVINADHPYYGQSICLTMTLPLAGERSAQMMETILELNAREQTIHEVPWSLGSWFLDEEMTPRIGYRLWLPHGLFQRNLLINLAVGMVARARRCCESIAGMSFEEAYPLAEEAMVTRLQSVLDMLGGNDEEENLNREST